MNLQQVLDMPVGKKFKFRGSPAEVVWSDKIRYMIMKGNKSANDLKDQADIYFKSEAIYFTCEGKPEGVTLASCFPKNELIDAPDYAT